jgi:SPP1 gp7 family putative phage head morphogenesis protein
MKDAMTNIGDAKINRDALIRLYTARLDGKVSVVIDDHQVNVQKALEQFGWNSIKPINPMLDAEIARFSKEAYQLTAGNLIDLGNDTVGSTMNNLNRSFNNYIRPEAPPRYIAKEIVLETPLYKNQNLAGMWETLTDNERMRIEQTIRLGLSKGAKEADTIREVMKTFKLTRSHATGLVVTSTTSVYNQVDHAVYTANSAYLGGYQYISILDSRTTLICTHLDGRVFPISDISHRPPQHFYCRSTTLPVPKSWDKLRNLDAVKAVRNQNIAQLSAAEIEKYDIAAAHTFTGNTFEKLSYNDWLRVQPANVQLVHLGDVQKLRLFQQGQLLVDKFSTPKGASIGLRELKMLTGEEGTANTMGASVEGTSRTFELAKERLDSLNLGFTSPDELINKPEAMTNLVEYYKLQSGDLNGQLSLTNYRGILPHVKKGTKNRVLQATPTEEQLVFNPITKRREDARIYAPNKAANERAVRLVEDSEVLTDKDKAFILQVKDELTSKIGINETSVVTDNIRVVFERFRKNDSKPWLNLKAVLNTEMNHSLTNVSEYIETNLRNNADFFYKIKQEAFLDPILGATQLEDLAKSFHDNIIERNLWEVRKLPTIAWELKPWINKGIPLKLRYTVTGESRMSDVALDNFYVKFAKKLALDNAPDRDQLAVSLGRDLFTMANMRGSKKEWYDSGVYLLDRAMESGFYELETFGVKKRRMRSRMSGQYFGQYYDTFSQNIIIRDKRIKRYSYLNRAIDVGYRIGVNDELKNQMFVRPGYKTYFIKNKAGFYYDTRIPITSSSSFVNLPTELIDENMADAMNWYSQSQYKVDNEFHSFVDNMLNFRDDRGNAKLYEDLNGYKKYISGRSDSYERFKMMEYFKSKDMAFSNHAFIDHRGRFYDSGFIGPQSGETFRPFLNSPKAKALGQDGYHNIVDQVGGFLGGLSDTFEGQFNGLSQTGRVKIFEKYRNDLVEIGKAIRRNKPNDIRFILDHHMMLEIDPEDQGKFLRFALEVAKIDEYLRIPRGRHIANVTQALMDERVDVAGLARMLGVENKAVANYAGTPSEIIKSQAELIRLAKTGKISESDASNALKWLHTTDVELTKTRYERATYKTFDHDTGAPLSTAKIAENKEKFIARSKGNTRKYITTQVVEELGELLDEHLKTSYLKPDNAL